jgi:epoxyqueuosine reductase QueG
MLTQEVKDLARSMGANQVGIADAARLRDVPGYKPQDLVPDATSVIVIGKRLLRGSLAKGRGRPVAWATVHLNLKLNEIAYEVAGRLEDQGYHSFPVFFLPMTFLPPDDLKSKELILTTPNLSYRHAAVQAGLGEIGKNNLLLTPEYGARMRLVGVITNAPLTPDAPFSQKLCRWPECTACIDNCPSKALSAEDQHEFARCNKYHNANLHLLGYGSCSMCQHVCPVGD